jgi:hypothetical protein
MLAFFTLILASLSTADLFLSANNTGARKTTIHALHKWGV